MAGQFVDSHAHPVLSYHHSYNTFPTLTEAIACCGRLTESCRLVRGSRRAQVSSS